MHSPLRRFTIEVASAIRMNGSGMSKVYCGVGIAAVLEVLRSTEVHFSVFSFNFFSLSRRDCDGAFLLLSMVFGEAWGIVCWAWDIFYFDCHIYIPFKTLCSILFEDLLSGASN